MVKLDGFRSNATSSPGSSMLNILRLPAVSNIEEPLVRELERLGRDRVATGVQRRALPLDGIDTLQLPTRDLVAMRVEQRDLCRSASTLAGHLRQPLDDRWRAFFRDGASQRDVRVDQSIRKDRYVVVVAERLVRVEVELPRRAVTPRHTAEAEAVDGHQESGREPEMIRWRDGRRSD